MLAAALLTIGAAACTVPPEGRQFPIADDPFTWEQVGGAGPPARWGHVMAFDPTRNRMLVFGGAGCGFNCGDVWAYSLSTQTWQQIPSTGGPDGRATPAAIVDVPRDRLIVVGGVRGFTATNQVWSLNLQTNVWTQLPSGPSARFDLAAATDGQKAWVFGGFNADNAALNELWQLDLATNTWQQLTTGDTAPAPRTNVGFGLIGGDLVVTGGHPESGINEDTWRYDLGGQSWTKLTEANAPLARAHYAYATDPTCGLLWLFGGDRNDFNDSSELLAVEPDPSSGFFPASTNRPTARRHSAIGFAPPSRTLVLFGGWEGEPFDDTTLGDTWVTTVPPCA